MTAMGGTGEGSDASQPLSQVRLFLPWEASGQP